MNEDYIRNLITKYLDGTSSPMEQKELEAWYASYDRQKGTFYQDDRKAIRAATKRSLHAVRRKMGSERKIFTGWRAAVAAILLVSLGGGYFIFYGKNELGQPMGLSKTVDIFPARNNAVLTLADGRAILLKNDRQGIILAQGKTSYSDGTAVMDDKQQPSPLDHSVSAGTMMSLHTPKGSRYQVILADGTKVWLNAQSTLRYPATFTANIREVELTGEAYFQVKSSLYTQQAAKTFVVKTRGQVIHVLGTEFNVSCYELDSAVATTLVNGAVQVQLEGTSIRRLLKPGQKAQTISGDNKIVLSEANVEEEISWKDNYFKFTEESIQSIMAKLARWYNVDVQYDTRLDLGKLYFSGSVSCQKSLKEALHIMELTGTVHFIIEGREVKVMP